MGNKINIYWILFLTLLKNKYLCVYKNMRLCYMN